MTSRSKVERVIDDYNLEGVDDELERRWEKGEHGQANLLDVTTYFNRRVFQSAVQKAGMSPIESEIGNYYRVLTSENASNEKRRELRSRLEWEGVNIERLQRAFVSSQDIYAYLTHHRGSSDSERGSDERVRAATQQIDRLRNRTGTIIEKTLDSLQYDEDLRTGELNVEIEVIVSCEDCGVTGSVHELLDDGRCDCSDVNGGQSND